MTVATDSAPPDPQLLRILDRIAAGRPPAATDNPSGYRRRALPAPTPPPPPALAHGRATPPPSARALPSVRPPDPLQDSAAPVVVAAFSSEPPVAPKRSSPSNAIGPDDLLQLLWFDPAAVPRMRRRQTWRNLLDRLEDEQQNHHIDDDALNDDAVDVEDHRDTFELLSHANAHHVGRVDDILTRGRSDDGKFVPPLALFAGHLRFPFDALETLKATISAALPFAAADETLKAVIDNANTVVECPNLVAAPELAHNHTKRIKDAFRRLDRLVSRNYLESQTHRALLEGRHYQRRQVFGDEHIRALLLASDESDDGVPTYLPDTLTKQLPMFERFRVRLIATVQPAASQFERHPLALRVVALGRIWRPA
ncbi:MAG TPA: hypothetical protein ENK23_07980 [Sorangium sp.]|nr:hypothetical protein [Sorangium sp.]